MKKWRILWCIFIISLIVLFMSNYKAENSQNNFINSNENIELAIYINEEETNTIPSKDSGYYLDLEKSTCTNNAIIQFDTNTWSPVIKKWNSKKSIISK